MVNRSINRSHTEEHNGLDQLLTKKWDSIGDNLRKKGLISMVETNCLLSFLFRRSSLFDVIANGFYRCGDLVFMANSKPKMLRCQLSHTTQVAAVTE
ncbi:hypothetical protein BLOT_006552 [Blomia tropicalis]|nr:hypothetical protein BLOT_006552 [Blomia tropicalis]